MIDRSNINRALAKAIAYKNCGKDKEARVWAAELVSLLGCAAIIDFPFVDRMRRETGELHINN